MKITTYETQVKVNGSDGKPDSGANIYRVETYCACMDFFGYPYAVRKPSRGGTVIMLIPSSDWIPILEEQGYKFIGKLEDIINEYEK